MHKVFTKQDRELLYGILNGKYDGVPVAGTPRKIQEKLQAIGLIISKELISQRLHWLTNDQMLWQCAYALAGEERPGLFEEKREWAAENLSGIPTSRTKRVSGQQLPA